MSVIVYTHLRGGRPLRRPYGVSGRTDQKADTNCASNTILRAEPFHCAKRIGPYGWVTIIRLDFAGHNISNNRAHLLQSTFFIDSKAIK